MRGCPWVRDSGAGRPYTLRHALRASALLPFLLTGACLGQSQNGHPAHPADHTEFTRKFVAAAIERTHHAVRYVSAYVSIPYPGGDIPGDTGVCTDEVIRSYRAVGGDL